jgi:catalase
LSRLTRIILRYVSPKQRKEPPCQQRRFSHNENGAPVADNNIETAGPRGPALLQDIWLIEKLFNQA